jgi:subtilisin family serine protease
LTVGATTFDNSEIYFSNFGPCVQIWAPGVGILTDDLGGGFAASNGTSYSAPHVAGTAALYLSTHPTATPAEVETALKSNAYYPGFVSKDGRPVKIVNAAHF